MVDALHRDTPVIVGVGDITDLQTPGEQGRSPYDLAADAARLALADSGADRLAEAIDTVAMLRSFADTSHRFASRLGASRHPPRSVARRLGLSAGRLIYTWNGGNMPQVLANHFAESISRRETRAVLVVGAEALRTQLAVERAGLPVSWDEDPGGEPELFGDPRRGWNDHEDRHHLRAAIAFYPLFENAIRGSLGRDVPQHLQAIGELMARFARVAQDNPRASRRDGLSARQLSTVDERNRWIGFPYPRLMNSNAFVDQAAAFVLTSVGTARDLGIASDRWVFLHGCAEGNDHYYVSERIDFHSSPAIRAASRAALDMAGVGLSDISLIDLYSCFPSAIQIACREIGLAEDDPRGLTVTGGLPFFGGPGNNYVTHSIVEMVRRLRAAPERFGLVTANGNYVTKHAVGIYSTRPVAGQWQRPVPTALQATLGAMPKAPFTETPDGDAVIETFTVMHDRQGPQQAIVFGRETATGRRFLANTPTEPAVLHDLQQRESLGRAGRVVCRNGLNLFTPA